MTCAVSDVRLTDRYPTRVARSPVPPAVIPRRSPVVWGSADDLAAATGVANAATRFDTTGFLAMPGYFPVAEAALWLEEARRLERWAIRRRPREAFFEQGTGALRSLFDLSRLTATFSALARDSRLTSIAAAILDDEVYVHQSRINYKPALDGTGFAWHSDFETWHAEDGMPDMRAVSMSIALTENTPFNGPVILVPGSHRMFVPCAGTTPDDHYRQSLVKQEVGTPAPTHLAHLMEEGGLEMPTGPAGSLLVFDCNVMHGSYANVSAAPRINLFLVYNATSNALRSPYGAHRPRPDFVADRTHRAASA